MTTDAPPPTRRELRQRNTGPLAVLTAEGGDADAVDPADGPARVAAAALAQQEAEQEATAAPVTADEQAPGDAAAPDGRDESAASGDAAAPDATDPAAALGFAPTIAAPPAAAEPAGPAEPAAAVAPAAAPAKAGPLALLWVDDERLRKPEPVTGPAAATSAPRAPDLLARAPRRTPWRAGVLIPVVLLLAIVGAYAATTLLWPLHAVAPRIEAVQVQPAPAAPATPAWPGQGSAAVSVAGIDGALASSGDAVPIASITKVVTALVVLDRLPLAVGESGPEYRFSTADRTRYWQYRAGGESALDVPVGGALSEYQMLEGMLIGSANNYADRLASNLWPTDAVYADAANSWLAAHGVPGVTVADPSGIESENAASAEALLGLAERAMTDPVIADIVGRANVSLPGAGNVENTNNLLEDPGVVGLKTGTLDSYNLLSAKDIAIGDTTVRVYASVLGQPDSATRDAATRALFAQIEQELQLRPSVAAGTVAGEVVTEWGEPVDIVTSDDVSVVLWNGGAGTPASEFALGDAETAGDVVGELSVEGPLNSAAVELELAGDVEGPDAWWRLTHPLELFGLV